MPDREKTIEALRECLNDDAVSVLVPWDVVHDAWTLLKAHEPIKARLHLCESCTKEYPECDATIDGIEFGSGVGNDNIIGCTAYVNRWKAQEPRVMTLEEVREAVDLMEPLYVCEVDSPNSARWMIPTNMSTYGFEERGSWKQFNFYDYLSKGLGGFCCWTSRPTDEQRKEVRWNDD